MTEIRGHSVKRRVADILAAPELSTNHPTDGAFTFSDTLPPGSPRRFYRTVLLP